MTSLLLSMMLLPGWFSETVSTADFNRAKKAVVVFVPLYPGDCAKCTVEAGAILRTINTRAQAKGKKVLVYTLVYAKRGQDMEYLKSNGYTFGTTILDPDADRIISLQKGDRSVLLVAFWPGYDGVSLRHVGDVDVLGTDKAAPSRK
ncbi:MAG: hypothetical protein BGO89_00110 [Candidatus Kapaibacterium thiocyanatum]|uniref:Uncharacterized protein n=1 Tax=Candidatus Kapaibacterium thiocyanatum TaxID=1895771 RepID=A0A1M3L170_9BACT|nr:MAG: hypothetical protein BGO89_00110 ['Candidatus Kapabacteria' thiocyanatum]